MKKVIVFKYILHSVCLGERSRGFPATFIGMFDKIVVKFAILVANVARLVVKNMVRILYPCFGNE